MSSDLGVAFELFQPLEAKLHFVFGDAFLDVVLAVAKPINGKIVGRCNNGFGNTESAFDATIFRTKPRLGYFARRSE